MIRTYRLVPKGLRDLTGYWRTQEEVDNYLAQRHHDPADQAVYVVEGGTPRGAYYCPTCRQRFGEGDNPPYAAFHVSPTEHLHTETKERLDPEVLT